MQKRLLLILFVLIYNFLLVFANATETPEKYFEKAYVHFWHQKYDSALFDFQKFIDAESLQENPRKSKIASMYRYRGHCFESLQLFDFAIAENQKAWQIYAEISDSANVSVTLQKLGDLFYHQGKPEQALFFVNKAIPYFEKMRWISKLEMAYFLMGEIYFELGDLEAAKTSFEKILTIQTFYGTKTDHTYLIGKVYFYLAKILRKRNLFEKTDSLLNLAEKIFVINSNQLPQFNANVIELWLFKAGIGPSDKEAKQLISKAAELLPKAQGMANGLEIANISFYLGVGDMNMAEEKLQDFEKQMKTAEISAKNQREYLLLYTEFLDKKYKKQSSVEFLKKKLEILDHYFFQSKNSKNIYSLLNDYAFSGQKNKILFDVAVKTSLQIYELTADKNYLEKAFQYAEYFSYNEINKNRSNSGKNLQHEKQIELAHLNFKINELIAEIEQGEKQKQDELVLLINEFENLQRFFQPAFEKDFFQNYRHLLADLQQTLGENELYLKFYETDSLLFQFIISAEHIELNTIDKNKQFLTDLQGLSNFISAPPGQVILSDIQKYANSAFQLFTQLIPSKTYHTIVVDWPLQQWVLPFEVLLCNSITANNLNMGKFPFLVKETEVCYSGSAILYLLANEVSVNTSIENYAGFAPFAETSKRVKNRLNFSENEIREISKWLNGETYFGEEASKNVLFEKAEQVKIIQLSTHAKTNLKYPQLSEIQFSSTESTNSNRLFFYEIVENNWNNELVILSACNTGVGEHFANYGTVSLANAFQLGGAKSVIGANWLASDFVSSEIITKTMENCVNGMDIGVALQKAKIHFLETSDDLFTHPFYWAVYSYQGAEKKLVLNTNKSTEIYWGIIPFAFLVLFYFTQKFIRARKINR